MNLKDEILERLENEVLFEWHIRYPSIRIDKEITRRLSNCDYSILEHLEKIEKTSSITQGLLNFRKCIPWRIGVIYDYTSGQIKNVEISVGKFGRYNVNGKSLTFTWLEANKHKKMLREIVSQSSPIISENITTQINEEKSLNVLDLLLKSKSVYIKIGFFSGSRTFNTPFAFSENYELLPVLISDGVSDIHLLDHEGRNPSFDMTNISIQFSPEVLHYIKIMNDL